MICLSKNKDGPDVLIGHLEGTLDAAKSAELIRHAEECAECRGLLNVWNGLDGWQAPVVSADFDTRLYAKIAVARHEPWWRRVFWRPAVPLAAAALTAVLAVGLWMHPRPVETPRGPAIENREIEQAAQALEDLDLLSPMNGAPADKI